MSIPPSLPGGATQGNMVAMASSNAATSLGNRRAHIPQVLLDLAARLVPLLARRVMLAACHACIVDSFSLFESPPVMTGLPFVVELYSTTVERFWVRKAVNIPFLPSSVFRSTGPSALGAIRPFTQSTGGGGKADRSAQTSAQPDHRIPAVLGKFHLLAQGIKRVSGRQAIGMLYQDIEELRMNSPVLLRVTSGIAHLNS